MGSEANARLARGKRRHEGKALLETDEVLFRGKVRARIALRDVRRATGEGDDLVLALADGTVERLELGAKVAERWARKITAPPSRLDKLGVKGDTKLALVGKFPEADAKELEGAGAPSTVPKADVILFHAGAARELERVAALRGKMRDDAALWIVYPKGMKVIREGDVFEAGRGAGLKDVKVARFSEALTALKFVVPVAERRAK